MGGKLDIAFATEEILGSSYQVGHPSYARFFPQRDFQLRRELSRWAVSTRVVVDPTRPLPPRQRLELMQADAVIFQSPEVGLRLRRLTSVPLVFDCIDWYEDMVREEFDGDSQRLDRISRGLSISCEIARAITCQSPVLLHSLTQRFPISQKALAVVPNGFDETLFTPAEGSERDALRLELMRSLPALRGFRSWLIYQGKLGRWYGALRACMEAVEEVPDVALICVGEGALREPLEALRLKSTFFAGAVPSENVPRYTRACDAAVFPANDCSPIAVSEYLACGLPVVARGQRLHWLIGLENGSLAGGDKDSWIQAIRHALERWGNDGARRGIAERARALRWRDQASKLLGVVESLLRQ